MQDTVKAKLKIYFIELLSQYVATVYWIIYSNNTMRQYNSCEKTLHLQDQWPCGFCLTCDPFPHQTLQLPPPGSWTGPPTGTLGPLGFYSLAPLSHPQHSLLLASQPLQMHCLPEKKVIIKVRGGEVKCPAVVWATLQLFLATWSRALSLCSLSSRLPSGRSLATCNSSFQSGAYTYT